MRVTLNDVAKKAGVTPSTVQRALNGVAGVSDKKREEIQEIAKKMGYKRNYMASSLKKGSIKMAIVLPEAEGNNRYYAGYLWNGAKKYLEEFTEFNVSTFTYEYERKPKELGKKLKEIFKEQAGSIQGVLTMGNDEDETQEALALFEEKNIPVVLVGTDATKSKRLCCVKTHDVMAGRMAADLLVSFNKQTTHSQIIITGNMAIEDQFLNAQGFEKQLLDNDSKFEIIKLSQGKDSESVKNSIKKALESRQDISAIFSTSARNTVPMCEVVKSLNLKQKIATIGSDIFPESVNFLKSNYLNAIIHKRPSNQAYLAMQTLVDYLMKNQQPKTDVILVDSVIVLKSNVECFI